MDGTQNDRHYKSGDTVKLEIVLHHRANLKEVRVIFTHEHDKTAAPLMARGQPRPISDRGIDGAITSRLEAKITLPRVVIPDVYGLARISFETAGGQLGHLEELLSDTPQTTFEAVG